MSINGCNQLDTCFVGDILYCCIIIACFWSIVWPYYANANTPSRDQDPLVISHFELEPVLEYAISPPVIPFASNPMVYNENSQLNADQLSQLQEKVFDWKTVENNLVNMEHQTNWVWFRFDMNNPYPEPMVQNVEIANPLLDYIHVYQLSQNQLDTVVQSGRKIPFAQRPYQHRLFVFPINLAANSQKTLYFAVKAIGPMQVPIKLWGSDLYQKVDQQRSLFWGMVFGLLALMFFYGIITYAVTKELCYGYFCLFVLSCLANQATFSGFAYQYLWPDSPGWNQYAIPTISSLVAIFSALFTITFLHLKHFSRRLYQATLVLLSGFIIILPIIYLVAQDLAPLRMLYLFYPWLLVSCFLAIITGFYLWLYRKQKQARFYSLAWGSYFTSIITIILYRFGVLDLTMQWQSVIAALGVILNTLLLSVAITDRLQAAQAKLIHNNQDLATLLEEMPNLILVVDHNFKIIRVNNNLCQRLQFHTDQLLGHHFTRLVIPDDREKLTQTLTTTRVCHGLELTYQTADAQHIPVVFSHATLDNFFDRKIIVCVADDVTELKRMEQDRANMQKQLLHNQRLEVLGSLAGGVTHDINNILTPVVGFSETLLQELTLNKKHKKMLMQINQSGLRGKAVVQQLLQFSRKSEDTRAPLDLVQTVKEAMFLVKATLSNSVQVTHYFQCKAVTVVSHRDHIFQILLNLCGNAQHAFPDNKGCIDVRLTLSQGGDGSHLEPGDYCCLSVTDNGCGIDEATLDHIFEPFFTTKDVGQGTGLGLSTVYGLVQKNQGEITVNSQVGQGSTFSIYFPCQHSLPPANTRAAHGENRSECGSHNLSDDHKGKQERILYVDDEPAINYLMEHSLTKLGYRVTTTTDARQALHYIETQPAAFDLLISDHTMPQMTGPDLARAIRQKNNSIPIVFVTGETHLTSSSMMQDLDIKAMLEKPIDTQVLAKIIRQILGTKQK